MTQHKDILVKIVRNKLIRNYVEFILRICLPAAVYLRIKRWVSLKLTNRLTVKSQHNVKDNNNVNIFHIVPFASKRKKVDLVICCAFKGRHEILEKSIMESIADSNDYIIEWFICGSSEEDLQFIKKMAIKTGKVSGILWKNNPLGEKWHFCVKAAGDLYDAELYAITGSDDILSSTLLRNTIAKHKNNLKLHSCANDDLKVVVPAMYCTNNWVIVRMPIVGGLPSAVMCNLMTSNFYVPLGAGRFYSKEFLHQVDFNVFDINRDSCLDDYGYFKAIELGCAVEHYDINDGYVISVKGNWQQMNVIDDIINADNIQTKDYTFLMLNSFKKEVSPELFVYLFKEKQNREEYCWA